MNTKSRATLSDVARRAGVSPVTVSRAIRHPEMVSAKLKQRVDAAVASLNYIPNHLASALASTQTGIVGVVVPSFTNGVFDDFLTAVQDVLGRAGIQALVLNVRYSEAEEERAIERLLGYHPEAMIVTGIDQTERSREMLSQAGVPIVQVMDTSVPPIDMSIGLDHAAAGFAAVRYLHDQGHTSIAHLTARGDPRARRRAAGWKQAMEELGLPTAGLLAATPYISTVELGGALFSEVIDAVPEVSAVFTCNDDLALGTLFECERRGLRVPEDVAIVGFNDLDFCSASVPPLTSVSTERRRMGTWAAEAILEIIRGSGNRPAQKRVDLGFIIKKRGSTAVAARAEASPTRRAAAQAGKPVAKPAARKRAKG